MAFVLAMLLLARAADVPPAELAAAVQSMRPRTGEPIAIVTPNRPAESRAIAIVGEGDYVFSRAGSASETRLAELGVTCAVFLERQSVSRSSPWIVTGVGDCTALPPPIETVPQSLEFIGHHHYRMGMNLATWHGLIVLPATAGVAFAVGSSVAYSNPYGATVLILLGGTAAILAPFDVGLGSLTAARALRKSGVDVSIVPGATSLTLLGIAVLTPAFDAAAVGVVFYFGSFVSGAVQMAMNTAAYRKLDLEPSHAARFRVRPVPLVVDGMRGLALTGEF